MFQAEDSDHEPRVVSRRKSSIKKADEGKQFMVFFVTIKLDSYQFTRNVTHVLLMK